MSSQENSRLARRLTLTDSVVVGLGAMIGAGVFVAVAPAARAAGTGLLIGLLLAAILAYLNASSMAQLAAVYPESGGTYVYGRRRLGPLWGFLAGWGFVIGKIASCTAMALTFASYAFPEYAKPIAIGAVISLTAINYHGIKKTALATKILVALVLVALAVVLYSAIAGGRVDTLRISGGLFHSGISGILQSAGILFFAFAGYARIATLGEEVLEPQKTIPKAILISLAVTLALYVTVIGAAVLSVDVSALANSPAPMALVVQSGPVAHLAPVVRLGACLASLGVLLSLLAGVSRTAFAMAANRDLPHSLSAVHRKYKIPYRAELLVGALVCAIIAIADVRSAIGFSSFAILIYYAIANVSAWTLKKSERLWPRWLALVGAVFCLVIAFNLPAASVWAGLGLFSLGGAYYVLAKKG